VSRHRKNAGKEGKLGRTRVLLQGTLVKTARLSEKPSNRHKTIKDFTVWAGKIKGIFRISRLAQFAAFSP
jgi:hypothetical protein